MQEDGATRKLTAGVRKCPKGGGEGMKSLRLGLSRRDRCSQDRRGRSSQAWSMEHGANRCIEAHLLQEAGRRQDGKRKERPGSERANKSRVTRQFFVGSSDGVERNRRRQIARHEQMMGQRTNQE